MSRMDSGNPSDATNTFLKLAANTRYGAMSFLASGGERRAHRISASLKRGLGSSPLVLF